MDRHADNQDKRAALLQGAHHEARIRDHAREEAASAHQIAQERPKMSEPKSFRRVVREQAVGIALVVVVALLVVAAIVAVRAFMGGANSGAADSAAEQAASYTSPYDWENLDRSDGRFAYVVDGQRKSRVGVDVSENQHEVDWPAVASDGIEFAYVRVGYRGATEGDLYVDGQYWANLDGARAAGIDCGVYFFSQATTPEEAREEADFVIDLLGGTVLEYPIAFDSEVVADVGAVRTAGLSDGEMTAIAEAFCGRVEEAGYRSMVYGNRADLSRYDPAFLQAHRVWWAEYDAAAPAHNVDIVMWQYANSGAVAGIDTAVDLDIDLSGVLL